MGRKLKCWSYKNAIDDSLRALRDTRAFETEVQRFRTRVMANLETPQIVAGELSTSLGVVRYCEAVLLAECHPLDAWPRIHLVWRYEALDWKVYLDRATELFVADPQKAARRKLPIGIIEYNTLNAILMTMAFAATLGEDDAAVWFGDRCLRLMTEMEPIADPAAWKTGSVEPYLLELYCRWRNLDVSLAEHGICGFGPFSPVFACWNDAAALETAVHDLCDLHANKVVHFDKPNDDFVFGLQAGPYRNVPIEILFLQRVRRDLGLSIPAPDHPLLRSPIVRIPFPCPHSGYDPYIAEVLKICKRIMPNLNIPWEDKYQANGPSDSKCLPPLDISNWK